MTSLAVLRQVVREESHYAEIGHLATMLAHITIDRPDLVVTIRRGVISVGIPGGPEPCEVRSGVVDVEPYGPDWEFAVAHAGTIPLTS